MQLSTETKEGLIGIALASVIFWLLTKTVLEKEKDVTQPPITDENISVAITAYMSAVENNEPQSVLNDLNASTARDYGLRVYERKRDNKFVVTDLSGNEVRVV